MTEWLQKIVIFVAFAVASCSVQCWGPARADEGDPLPDGLVCEVQREVRWRSPAWTEGQCRTVSRALAESRSPRLLAAVCLNESDLRQGVLTFVREGVYDVGLCGVRCVTSPGSGDVLGRRCLNGLARGYRLRHLLDAPTNVRLADRILHEQHGGDLRRYNGGTREHGYAGRVGALHAALGGVDVRKRCERRGKRETRVERMVRLILRAFERERLKAVENVVDTGGDGGK